jgi:hypothetical protein
VADSAHYLTYLSGRTRALRAAWRPCSRGPTRRACRFHQHGRQLRPLLLTASEVAALNKHAASCVPTPSSRSRLTVVDRVRTITRSEYHQLRIYLVRSAGVRGRHWVSVIIFFLYFISACSGNVSSVRSGSSSVVSVPSAVEQPPPQELPAQQPSPQQPPAQQLAPQQPPAQQPSPQQPPAQQLAPQRPPAQQSPRWSLRLGGPGGHWYIPPTYNIGEVQIGESRTYQLKVNSFYPVAVTAVHVKDNSNSFDIARDGCTNRTMPSESSFCLIAIEFKPDTSGQKEASISIEVDCAPAGAMQCDEPHWSEAFILDGEGRARTQPTMTQPPRPRPTR